MKDNDAVRHLISRVIEGDHSGDTCTIKRKKREGWHDDITGYPWRIRQKTNNKALVGVQWVNGAGVLEVWRWVLDGVSFVLGEKRAKTARELFPDALDIKAPSPAPTILQTRCFFFYFRWVSLENPITSKVNSFDVDNDTLSLTHYAPMWCLGSMRTKNLRQRGDCFGVLSVP
ncbi:hypothetical protein NC651_005973 [Populus alba x Populus x berolinensis]|nr:hypothetical protein NC651_005973 [Populus alba x Populus x berolinensis]